MSQGKCACYPKKCTNACTDVVVCSNGLISKNPELCYREDIQLNCCKSCNKTYTGIKGCEYGDKLTVCNKLLCDIGLFNQSDCCRTCSPENSVSERPTTPNVKCWNYQSVTQTPPPTANTGQITGGIVGVIVFLIMVILIGYVVRRKVFRRQEEAAHLLIDNRPAVPLRVKSLRKEKKNTENRSAVHTYDLPDNGYIDVFPVLQMSLDTANGHSVYKETMSSATAGSPVYLNFSNGDEVSSENVIKTLTWNSHERTDDYLTGVAEHKWQKY
ncbi:hypothetical protein CHS0354_016326 [Potamilus streckersoni]|uniref:Uncharacterized protein n=1 Tax=Potamilus streckersoni TaxID=2493646 RepID=A0AAE0S785_9BIVA|nr:hypothetical protein CHS0354_016326 [Potamilus streckersoni]